MRNNYLHFDETLIGFPVDSGHLFQSSLSLISCRMPLSICDLKDAILCNCFSQTSSFLNQIDLLSQLW